MPPASAAPPAPKIEVRDLTIRYGEKIALSHATLAIQPHTIHAIIGPAGSGKTSLLRTLNLLATEVDGARIDGEVLIDGENILTGKVDVASLRRRVGMVFAQPQPLPRSIFENLVYGPRLAGVRRHADQAALVEESLRAAQLWDEVKDRLHNSALALSGGQQQRLCIARALAVEPEIVLMDEPASALDPIATQRIEELIYQLKSRYTIVIVTHNMQQAARVSDVTAFFWLGKLIECDRTNKIFTAPSEKLTEDYITGRFG